MATTTKFCIESDGMVTRMSDGGIQICEEVAIYIGEIKNIEQGGIEHRSKESKDTGRDERVE